MSTNRNRARRKMAPDHLLDREQAKRKDRKNMSLISISSDTPDDLFKPPEFPVINPGRHQFTVANKLEVTQSSGDDPKDMIKLEARCIDEDENKGRVVFHNFLLIAEPSSEKERTSKRINDAELAQFIVACGILTKEQMAAGEQFDLDDLFEKNFEAMTKVVRKPAYPEELDETGKKVMVQQSAFKKFLFEPTTA